MFAPLRTFAQDCLSDSILTIRRLRSHGGGCLRHSLAMLARKERNPIDDSDDALHGRCRDVCRFPVFIIGQMTGEGDDTLLNADVNERGVSYIQGTAERRPHVKREDLIFDLADDVFCDL